MSPASVNTKKYPFIITKARRKGRCKMKKVVEIRTKRSNLLLGTAENKTKAIELAKDLIKKQREDLYGKTVYATPDLEFEMKYDPSIRAKMGQYIIFGVDDEDVRINKRKNRGFE
uniref:Uncharacterized protein n=1 Tax=CrAss-like virus sp. ctYsL76 TaxID=2826826 RepID=A0A8S5QMX9_9CAUD|nr:MAG TPA: hypothetical protein [CrAss-like virus sp. ctYsL76]